MFCKDHFSFRDPLKTGLIDVDETPKTRQEESEDSVFVVVTQSFVLLDKASVSTSGELEGRMDTRRGIILPRKLFQGLRKTGNGKIRIPNFRNFPALFQGSQCGSAEPDPGSGLRAATPNTSLYVSRLHHTVAVADIVEYVLRLYVHFSSFVVRVPRLLMGKKVDWPMSPSRSCVPVMGCGRQYQNALNQGIRDPRGGRDPQIE
ncbi:hypothetical protein MSG28_014687 [Choristoneura fumiferana]|uniref:Uncharacterized protein n=1 Tax=Choristoneura fumiferana TaxID=7141 RepID=A0ACC0JS99_CHOFU|nr:hypothetical protein MSG28_014687 [Choristoneura fumiferana]